MPRKFLLTITSHGGFGNLILEKDEAKKLLQDTVIRDKENSKNIFFINYFFGRILI